MSKRRLFISFSWVVWGLLVVVVVVVGRVRGWDGVVGGRKQREGGVKSRAATTSWTILFMLA